MRPDMQLDYAVFQLNPTRTRCELHISAQGMTYKLAAGLLQPFVAHLKAAEEQVAGGSYSVRLEPPDPGCAGWFTKGTMERFVRFVSTPEVLERANNIEMELIEIEKNLHLQSRDSSEDPQYESSEGAKLDMEEAMKQRLRALEARRMMLEKELGVALARAITAGFTIEHIKDLIVFAETFGAKRLWGACSNFMSLCKTRQQSGAWQDDVKLSVAEVAHAEMAFGSNVVHPMVFKESLDLQGRGSRQNDLRRASLPSEGRPLLVDSGLEKLTRRGSLDELTDEFLQVAARMRSSGMMEGANVDWSNNWQAPIGGGNRPVSGEMQVGVAHLGGNNDLRDSESALKLARGHQIMAAWRGQPQNHPMHNVHPLMHGPMHPSIPASFGFPGLPVPGYSYPPCPGNPYMGHAYAEANGWQFPSPVPPPFWPHPMINSTAAPAANERGEVALSMSQKHEANHNTFSNNNELHEELTPSMQKSISELPNVDEFHGNPPSSTQRSANDQPVVNQLHGETPGSTQRPASDLSEPSASTEGPASDLHVESTPKLASDLPGNEDTQQTVIITQQQLPIKNEREEESTNDSFHDGDGETYAERTRRLPIRSSSPSRRSASPLKKVQIGRSSSRRAIRNVNYVAQDIPEKIERENNDRESSESWSEDNDDGKNDKEPKEQPVRARVQDVIGLFEKKKDVGDTKLKPLRKEIGRIQSNNSVLKRWNESGAFKKEASETEDSIVINRITKGASGASADDLTERGMSERKEERMSLEQEENAELAVASKVESCTEQQASDKQPPAKESIFTRNNPSNPESEVPNNQTSGGGNCNLAPREQSSEPAVLLVPESSKELAGRSRDVIMDDDAQVLGTDMVDDVQSGQQKTDVNDSLNDGQENEDGDAGVNPGAAHSKKVSARDAKAKAMQELLERRKAASGNRSGKPNPLAEAQLRAEKLRAYKAGLQKSKQEKDEEEKKRIEDLKSQRKDRIAARGSPQGGSSAQSLTTRQAPQNPLLTGNRSSPTVISHKLSSSSPRNSINVSASSLSPNLPKSKGAGNKLLRTPTGTPKANENALSLSVPSLSELKKLESPKATSAVRSSTGSQRLSQLRKNLKDADPNTSPKANGHSEEKRRSLPLATVRKGIPPANDSKNEGLPVVKKPSKDLMAANKQQKKPGSSPASVKPKKPAREAVEVTSFSEQVDATNDAAVEVSLELETEAGNDKQELSADNTEASLDNNCFSLQEVGTTEDGKGYYSQIRAPASSETEILGSTDDSSCFVDGELATSSEPLVTEDLKETEAPMVVLESHKVLMACIEGGEHTEADSDKNTEDNYCAPVAHVSPTDENSTTFKDFDASREELSGSFVDELPSNLNVSTDELPISSPPAEVYNPPRALPSDSPLHIPQNLPRLHEAIQQAHSPEFIPGVNRSRKTRGDESGSVRSSKDHAKGFKRLLLLGRKSSRTSSSQNAADWVSVSMVSEVGDDGEGISPSNAKKVGGGSAIPNVDSATHRGMIGPASM